MFDNLELPHAPSNHYTGLPLIADSFAGGGGASTGIEMALGRSPDVAINHDPVALSMHEANHPNTKHLITSVYAVDPRDLLRRDQKVGLAWFSPDCKHHSKAKGGKPLDSNIRGLAWVVLHWAKLVRPDVIMLENVEEFQDWGPLTAENKPDVTKKGQTFRTWVRNHRSLGYRVEWRELKACDYGAPTIRKRLFVIMRCDGKPIFWPKPTHGKPDSDEVKSGELKPWRTAAEIIDWSLPCPSIFDTSAEIMDKHALRSVRPLADNTLKRIARGLMRYVIQAEDPFFVTYGQHGGATRSAFDPMHTVTASIKDQNAIVVPSLVNVANSKTTGRGPNAWNIEQPVRTLTSSSGFALVAAHMMPHFGQSIARSATDPVGTLTAGGGGKQALIATFMAQHNTGAIGRKSDAPLSTLTTRATQQNLVAAHMVNMHGTGRSARDARHPVTSICAGGTHAGLVAAFLTKYYGQGVGQSCAEGLHTLTGQDRFGVVTVNINSQTYAITDIGMRMLTPREQFRAQGFPETYVIDRGADGKVMTKTAQTQKCGNSVCPPVAAALVRANCPDLIVAHCRQGLGA